LFSDDLPHPHVDFHILPEADTTMDNEPTFFLRVNQLRIERPKELVLSISNDHNTQLYRWGWINLHVAAP
jgi:hypothetical protein